MADVTMSLDELKLMEKNQKLLEESLIREKELSNKVIMLEKEKNQALEDAKYNVTYTKKVHTQQTVLTHRSYDEIMIFITRELEFFKTNPVRNYSDHDSICRLIQGFFKKETHTMYDNASSETTTRGLDEVKVELKKEAIAEIENEYREALKTATKATEVITKVSELENSIASLQEKNHEIMEVKIAADKKYQIWSEKLHAYNSAIIELGRYNKARIFGGSDEKIIHDALQKEITEIENKYEKDDISKNNSR